MIAVLKGHHTRVLKLPVAATAQDFKVHYRHGKLYLILPERRRIKVRVRVPDGGEAVAAVDPGVRTPFTVYSPEGSVVELGTNAYDVLDKLPTVPRPSCGMYADR